MIFPESDKSSSSEINPGFTKLKTVQFHSLLPFSAMNDKMKLFLMDFSIGLSNILIN